MCNTPLSKVITERVQEGGIFVDIGGSNGFFSLLDASLVGSTGKFISSNQHQEFIVSLREISKSVDLAISVPIVSFVGIRRIMQDSGTVEGTMGLIPS